MKIIRALLLPAVLLSLGGCPGDPPPVESLRPVAVMTVESGEARDSKSFSGVIRERDLVRLSFRVAGQVEEIPVEEGRFVRKGELLARLDPRDYALQLEAVRAEHGRVTAEVKRYRELYSRKNITESEYEKAIAGERQINAKLRAVENELADTRMVAPFDGFVQALYVSENEMVDAGSLVVSLVDLSSMVVETNIPPSFFLLRERFEDFAFTTHHYPGEQFSLELIGIAAKADTGNLYRARFRYRPAPGFQLAPGMSVRVTIHYRTEPGLSVRAPVTAVVAHGDERYVWLFRDGHVTRRPVVTGMIDSRGMVAIVDGLSPGDRVVVAGVHDLREGQAVRAVDRARHEHN